MNDKKKKLPSTGGGGQVIKKPLGEKIAETLFSGTVKDAKSFALHEIIVPGIKNLIYEGFSGMLDRLFNGDSSGYYGGRRTREPWNSGVTIFTPGTSYTNYGTNKTKASLVAGGVTSSRTPVTIAFNRKADADEVLARLRNAVHEYSSVTVEAYYDIASEYVQGVDKVMSFTDNYYGWTDLSGARTKPYQGGRYIIVLPPTVGL